MPNKNDIDKKKFIYILSSLLIIAIIAFLVYLLFLGLLYKSEQIKEKQESENIENKIINETSSSAPDETTISMDNSSDIIENEIKLKKEKILTVIKENSPIYFIEDTVILRDQEISKLENIISSLSGITEMQLIISGHTDSVGNKEEEFDLSQKRAVFIKDYFIDKKKDITFDIKIEFYGSTKPAYTGDDLEKRYLNRRAEIEPVDMK